MAVLISALGPYDGKLFGDATGNSDHAAQPADHQWDGKGTLVDAVAHLPVLIVAPAPYCPVA